MISCKLIN